MIDTPIQPAAAGIMSEPAVSVVMPAYNAQAYLRPAIESVLDQTFTDFELIVVNDGSRDATREILAEYQRRDPRVRVFDQQNAGIVDALNHGIREARGRYIARMDSDDVCTPDRLAIQVEQMTANPDLVLLGSFVATTDESGEILSQVVEFPEDHDSLWASIGRRKWVFCHPAVMFSREVALAVGLYRRGFTHAEDTEFFARLMTRGRARNLPDVLLRYRLRRDAVCSRHREHGRVYAQVVAGMIDRWRPGQAFEPSAMELRAAEEQIARLRPESSTAAEAVYWLRIAREQLRGRQFKRAVVSYKKTITLNPWRPLAYLGILCALLRVNGRPRRRAGVNATGVTLARATATAGLRTPLTASSLPIELSPAELDGAIDENGHGVPPATGHRPAWNRAKDRTHA